MYGLRRGWTHGVLAMVALPLALAAAMRWWDRRQYEDGEPVRFGRLLALSALAVWSHPALDWLNTYGVRLGMPFDGRWFYGDALFILDPWMWLSAGAAVVLARSATRGSQLGWLVLALALSGPMLLVPDLPWVSRVVWLTGLVGVGSARALNLGRARSVARLGLALLIGYITSQIALTTWARGAAREALTPAHGAPVEVFAQPLPATPWAREIIAVYPDRYRFGRVGPGQPFEETEPPILKNADALSEAALAAPELAGFVNWLRFPAFGYEGGFKDDVLVHVYDVRYSRREGSGIGRATVLLTGQGNVVEVRLGGQ